MTSASFDRLTAGYYNPSLKSLANPGGLAGQGAVRANWTPMLLDFVTIASEAVDAAARAEAAAASATMAPGTMATSATPMAIPGAVPAWVTFMLQEPDKLFAKGQTVTVAADADPLNHFVGPITAFNPATKVMTIRALFASGTGAHSAWVVALSPPVDNSLTGRVAALEDANAQQRSDALFYAKEFI